LDHQNLPLTFFQHDVPKKMFHISGNHPHIPSNQ